MNLIKTIKSSTFALFVAILSVLLQSFHSYTAFVNMSSLKGTVWGVAQGILFATVIDLAILFYTVRNKTRIALGAALVMFIINGYYYYDFWGFSPQLYFGLFLALIIPVSVYFYSEEIGNDERDAAQGAAIREAGRVVSQAMTLAQDLREAQRNRPKPEFIKGGIIVTTDEAAQVAERIQRGEPVFDEKKTFVFQRQDTPADNSLLDIKPEPKGYGEFNPQRARDTDDGDL